MRRSRITYFIMFIVTIIVGLLSRHFKSVPLFIGDILWATMVYSMFRFVFVARSVIFSITTAVLFSFAIEFSQLYQASWINDLRHNLFGRLVLGEGFLWTDLLCYLTGIGIGILLERWILIRFRKI